MTPESAIQIALALIDLSVFSVYENFVSKLDVGDRGDRPVWMGTVDFSALKLKLVSSIVSISAISAAAEFHENRRRAARRRHPERDGRVWSSHLRDVGLTFRANG